MITRTKHLVLSAIKASIMSELTTKANSAMLNASKAKDEGDELSRRFYKRDEVAFDILFDLVDNYNVDLPRSVESDLYFIDKLYHDDSPGFTVEEMKGKIRDFAQYCFDAYALDFVRDDNDVDDNDVDDNDVDDNDDNDVDDNDVDDNDVDDNDDDDNDDNDVDDNDVDDNDVDDFTQVIVCASQFISQVTA